MRYEIIILLLVMVAFIGCNEQEAQWEQIDENDCIWARIYNSQICNSIGELDYDLNESCLCISTNQSINIIHDCNHVCGLTYEEKLMMANISRNWYCQCIRMRVKNICLFQATGNCGETVYTNVTIDGIKVDFNWGY